MIFQGESSRARRFNRGIKTLKDLIKQASAGKAINPDDIPPEVSTGENRKPENRPEPIENNVPVRKAPEIPIEPEKNIPEPEPSNVEIEQPDEKSSILKLLNDRKNEYKSAALKAKKTGDTQTAIKYMKVGKQFEMVIKAIEEGKDVDLSSMPGPPEEIQPGTSGVSESKVEENEVQKGDDPAPAPTPPPEEEVKLINPPTLLEGLIQRMEVYKSQLEKAQQEGNEHQNRLTQNFTLNIMGHLLIVPPLWAGLINSPS